MLWLAGKLSGEAGSEKRKLLVLTTCKCARLSLKYLPNTEKRPLRAIEITEQWARGENGITLDDVQNAGNAASSAASYAAFAYALAIAPAAYVAYTAPCAARAAAGDIARIDVLKQCADIVRADYPISPANEKMGLKRPTRGK